MTILNTTRASVDLLELDDRAALRRYVRRGDPRAFEVLAHRYQSMVFATCRRALGNDADAEDAAQETFLKLARHAGSIRSNAAAWLHAAAMGTSVDVLRRLDSRRRAERGAASAPSADEGGELSEAMLWRDIEPLLDRALSELEESDRELIVGRFLAGRSQRELAREVGVSDGTMHRRINRALARLRSKLGESGLVVAGGVTLVGALAYASGRAVGPRLSASIAKVGLSGIGHGATGGTVFGMSLPVVAAAVVFVAASSVGVLAFRGGTGGAVGLASSVRSQELGPARITSKIGPFEAVSAMDNSFSERGVWIGEETIRISHGVTEDGEPKRAILRIEQTDETEEGVLLRTRVRRISPPGDQFSRFERGQVVEIGASFDELGRMLLEPKTDGVQLGRNEPTWYGVRPPIGWKEYGRIPEDPGPFGLLGPWTEAERIPVTIDSREIRFGAKTWTERTFRIIDWERREGFSRVLCVRATGRDPRLIGTRFRLLIRKDENGYSLAYFPPGSGRPGAWPSSFEYRPSHPVRVISFTDGAS